MDPAPSCGDCWTWRPIVVALEQQETTMSIEQNKNLVQQFVEEFWSSGNMDAADKLMSPDVVIHTPPVGNVDGLKVFAAELRRAFPDWRSTVEEMIAEGDRVAERWTGRGTHLGDFQGIPSTGRQVEVPGVVFYRIAGGKIAEFRGSFDAMSMMQQLGVETGAGLAER
jgi:steroid delta-isomerase-like uncharacterized protein